MADSKTSQAVPIVTTLLSLFSALGVAYLTYSSSTAKTESDATFRNREISLEQTKFDAAQEERYQQNVVKIIAQILSKTDQDRLTGLATLRTLYPERAEQVLKTIASSTTEPQAKATLEAEALTAGSQASDPWVIIAGADASLAQAQTEQTRAGKAGLTAGIYHRNGVFRTVIGPFPTRTDADRANIAVRGALRNDAYPVRLSTWCPKSTRTAAGVVECVSG
jgi:cell division protein FtsN